MGVNIQELNNAENIFLNYLLPRIGTSSGTEHVHFVQVGANVSNVDGDPIFPYINANLWKGLLIEPIPHVFQELKTQLSHIEGLRFANCAISPEPGEKTIYFPEGRTVLASFDPAVVRSHYPGQNIALVEETVPCDTLENVIAANGISHIDVLVTDTEGHDAQILLNTDFTAITPGAILFEAKHLSAEDRQAAAEHLQKFGYIVIEMGANTFAVRPTEATQDFYLLVKALFTEFRNMEARSMQTILSLQQFTNAVIQSTPRS